jgi:desulfoferrodoxin-like iron-binding protein
MRKHGILFFSVICLAAAGLVIAAGCAKKSETPSETSMKTEAATPAPAPEEYTQEQPYSKDFYGPWDEAVSKVHLPEITYEKTDSGLKVTVKIDNHPMDPEKPHYIMWIRIEDGEGNTLGETDFVATDPAPVTTFDLTTVPAKIKAFERCNIHGIWTSETDVNVM